MKKRSKKAEFEQGNNRQPECGPNEGFKSR